MKPFVTLALCLWLVPSSLIAQVGRRGGGARVAVQNRSTTGNVNRTANVNRNANINQNVNVNRNVNVNVNNGYRGGCVNCYYHDNNWNWGSFAAGAATAAVTGAVVAAATRPASTTVVVAAPAIGTIVPTLPGSCSTVSAAGGVIYNCNSTYYRPYYQGTQLVYQVATYP